VPAVVWLVRAFHSQRFPVWEGSGGGASIINFYHQILQLIIPLFYTIMALPLRSTRNWAVRSRPMLTCQSRPDPQSRHYPALPPPRVWLDDIEVNPIPEPPRSYRSKKSQLADLAKDKPTEWILPIPEPVPKGTSTSSIDHPNITQSKSP
jgi:hypothetical protein